MKTSAIFVIALLCASAYSTNFNEQVKSMIQANAMATDAVDTVNDLLNQLAVSIFEEQEKADAAWAQHQIDAAASIADAQATADAYKEQAEAATEHREWVESEIEDSNNHIDWIDARQAQIITNLEQLQITRCEANQLFIQQLKETTDALDAIAILRQEVENSEALGDSSFTSLAETGENNGFTSKLQEYEHLFEVNAMNEFFQSSDDGVPDVHTDLEDFEYLDATSANREESGQVYTEQAQLDVDEFQSTVDVSDLKGTIFDQVRAMLLRLENSLTEGAAELETNEIEAAIAAARYQMAAAEEQARLVIDRAAREKYLEKLAGQLTVAQQKEDEAWERHTQAVAAVAQLVANLAQAKVDYNQAKTRRIEETNELDQIKLIFQQQIATMGDQLRNRVDDYVEDDRFDDIFGARSVDATFDESSGNIAAESLAAAGGF